MKVANRLNEPSFFSGDLREQRRGPCARKGIVALTMAMTLGAAAQAPVDVGDLLARVGERVEESYHRARSVICAESVVMQPLRSDWTTEGPARLLEYELRVSWEPTTDGTPSAASVLRRLVKVGGRAPRADAEPGCMDPHAVSPEPLAMLLPDQRGEYVFSWTGSSRVGKRPAIVLRYRSRAVGKAEATWKGDCVNFSLPGRSEGRIWIDPSTHEVLRFDESLTGRFDYPLPRERARYGAPPSFVIERADSSIRYRPVAFHDPEETLLLPERIESFQVIHGASVPRLRTTQTFSNYQRFVTETRIVR